MKIPLSILLLLSTSIFIQTFADTINGNADIQGSDIKLGLNDGRDKGSLTAQRAMVHMGNDELHINFEGDFEGGTKLQGPKFMIDTKFGRSSGSNDGRVSGYYVWNVNDSSHVIYSAHPSGYSPKGSAPANGLWDSGHRLRFRTYKLGQGFLFENSDDVALVDIDSDNGNLKTAGVIHSVSSGSNYFAGNVGIGVSNPWAKLQVSAGTSGDSIINIDADTDDNDENDNPRLEMRMDGGTTGAMLGFAEEAGGSANLFRIATMYSGNVSWDRFVIENSSGNIGIGTTTPDFKLDVNGNIRAKEIKVDSNWSDFVFEEGYDLPTLQEVESHIAEKGHLPGVPSAKEIQERGLDISATQTVMMQKIEELTLYAIEREKQFESLKKEKDAQISMLLQRLEALENKLAEQ